ncbi:MAG TPA: GAF domain-containing protein [Anaerolineales bacterium]|nr:GAF domain-containing protein [Anaerolineales bacterium]
MSAASRYIGSFSMLTDSRRRSQLDWLVSNLRWLLMVAVIVFAFLTPDYGFEGPFAPFLIATLVAAALYNLILMLLMLYETFPRSLAWITLGTDAALSVALIAVSGGFQSPFLFFGILPIITAALRFSFFISILVALFITLGYFGIGLLYASTSSLSAALPWLGNAATLLLAALVAGLVGRRMRRHISALAEAEQAEELRRLRARHQQSRLIFELASTLSATLNYQKVLEAMLDVGEIGLQELGRRAVSQVSIVFLFDKQQQLRVVASRRLSPRDERLVIPGQRGVVAQALMTAEPALSRNPGRDPELGQFIAMNRCQEAVAVPLRAGFEDFGVVVFGSPTPGLYTPDYQDLLVAMCNQAVVALQNARLYQDLMEEKERIVAVEEDARKKLARDLHDGPTQSIAAIAMRLNYVRKMMETNPEQAMQELTRLEQLARQTTKEIRHMLFTLRPLILETQGLRAALAQYIAKRAETDPLPVHLEAPEGVDERLNKDAQGVIFYIIEEAISNARKHAQAENVWVRLRVEDNTFIAEVEDDGRGFDLDTVLADYTSRGSLGMTNMFERAELVGGQLDIQTAPGRGTRVILTVPLERQSG